LTSTFLAYVMCNISTSTRCGRVITEDASLTPSNIVDSNFLVEREITV